MIVELDDYLNTDWQSLHEHACLGIARSRIEFASPGMTDDTGYKSKSIKGQMFQQLISQLPESAQLISSRIKIVPNQAAYLTFLTGANMLPVITVRNAPYKDKHSAKARQDTPATQHFDHLINWIDDSGMFVETGRIIIFLSMEGGQTRKHTDTSGPNNDEFVWLNPSGRKLFWVMSSDGVKRFVASYSAWFDTSKYHGSDIADTTTYSIRVDGVFTDQAREYIKQHGKI